MKDRDVFRFTLLVFCLAVGLLALPTGNADAQLVDCEASDQGGNLNAPGGCIAKNLEEQIGAGHGDVNTPGSAVYLIKRDPARSIRRGRQLFQRKFSAAQGQGPRVNLGSTGDITQNRALGAGLADSCAACHGRPRGSAGHGGDVNTFPDSRDSPHLFGLGIVEQLAEEVTEDLRAIRDQAIEDAQTGGSTTLIDADFENGEDGFVFVRDSGSSLYVRSGFFVFSDPPTTTLAIQLGDQDNATVTDMQGHWETSFELSSPADVTISFVYRMTQSSEYESDEISRTFFQLDGTAPTLLAEIQGDGNGGSFRTTGFQNFSTTFLGLAAGTHTIKLIGFNNKKTFNDEFSNYAFDDVRVTADLGPGPVTVPLVSKGISFGQITAEPDGTVDTSQVEGVDPDLRIKPFFAQGATISMREFLIGAFNAEMGLQAWDPVLCAATDPVNPQKATSPSGFVFDPAHDTFERPPACDAFSDPDGDGVTGEIDPAVVDHMEFYLLNYFKPGQYKVTQRANEGLELMRDIGCTECHVQNLTIDSDRRVADVETVYDPLNGIFNDLFATASTRFGDPVDDGDPFPQLLPAQDPFVVENIFTDLKRHDLGLAFEERDFDGTRLVEHITEPLWGVATTAPYGHDGRSVNLDQVIRRHGGEAQGVTDSYVDLTEDQQAKILEFLNTLVLFPPDDTASNLNPGDPNATDVQDPAVHGSINLGALFQIPSEGPE